MGYYLMIKQIDETGMKYLCKCKDNKDHLRYLGSGKLWRRILNRHPEYNVSTQVLGWFKTNAELAVEGLRYSIEFDVANSADWANLINEAGDGGDTIFGRRKVYDTINDVESHIPRNQELPSGWKEGGRRRGPRNPEVTARIVKAQSGATRGEQTRKRMSDAWRLGKRKPIPKYKCSHCGKEIVAPNLNRHERSCYEKV
jgi:hypothetical protein